MKKINPYQRLRAERLKISSRPFRARGKSVSRCAMCQLADFACLCPWRRQLESGCDFILLLHADEIFKPTNTGRLIADLLPHNVHVFIWDRTQPDPQLLLLLNDPLRDCLIVFPGEGSAGREIVHRVVKTAKKITFILLDGTWKQSGRMFHLSRWLDHLPCLCLPPIHDRGYAVRKSHQVHYLSTLEAAALCLQLIGEQRQADIFSTYFSLFNLHYLATRGCFVPELGDLHARMQAL